MVSIRAKKTEGGQTVLYVNRYYEKNLTTGEVATYYYLGDRMAAKRAGSALTYLHQDSLNSTSVVTNTSGAKVASSRYYPYGGAWSASGALPAQRFTGQRLDSTGLYYYNARYYDANLGRFISADTFVQWSDAVEVASGPLTVNSVLQGKALALTGQAPRNPQALNRYSYVVNNPLKFTDHYGWWTAGLGVNAQFSAFGWSFSASVMVVTSGLGELGVVGSWGGGGGFGYQPGAEGYRAGLAYGVTGQGQWTNATSIQELQGPSTQVGASGGAGLYGGAEWVAGESYQGVNVQAGKGSGFEMHGILEQGTVWTSDLQMPWAPQSDAAASLPIESSQVSAIEEYPQIAWLSFE